MLQLCVSGLDRKLVFCFFLGIKFASRDSLTSADSLTADEPIFATTVSRTTKLPDVGLLAGSPLNLHEFKHYLASHIDQE